MWSPDPASFIARGASAEVYRRDGGRVLKLFHAGIDPVTVSREYAIARTLEATGLPAPRALGRETIKGREGILYTQIEGRDLFAHIRGHPMRLAWAMQAMAEAQRDIHAQLAPALRSRKGSLAADIGASDINPALQRAAIDRLDLLHEGERLSHGDLHPENLIVTGEGLVVIDWSKAARAAPAADVVRTEMLLRFGPGPASHPWIDRARDLIAMDYVRRYRALTGMGREALTAWRALVALAWLRHRAPGRDADFARYLARAIAAAGLPPLRG